MQEENHEQKEGCTTCHMAGPMKKEFKLAMLEKKEKILKIKLDFIGKMKDMVEKIP